MRLPTRYVKNEIKILVSHCKIYILIVLLINTMRILNYSIHHRKYQIIYDNRDFSTKISTYE